MKKANTLLLKIVLKALIYWVEKSLTFKPKLKDVTKILILGDMFELGENSGAEHQKIAEFATRIRLVDQNAGG